MAEVVVSPEATSDVAEIHARGAEQFGFETADHYHDGLLAAILRLESNPQSGPVFPGIRPPVRYLAYKRHRILYDYDGKTVRVIRIMHHARDVRQLM